MTIDDIAKALNISKTTVSRAISGKGRVGQETREKVLSYISKNNYRPNAIAKGLAQSKTFNIGLVIPSNYNIVNFPFFQKCMWGISAKAASMDYDVIISMVTGGDITQLVRLVENHKVDGVILSRTLDKDDAEQYLKSRGMPFVAIGSSRDPSVIQVDNDNFGSSKELTSILLLKGVRRMALIGGNMGYMVNKSRLDGYRAAFEEVGVPIDSSLIFLNAEINSRVEWITGQLLKKDVDCILCMDDFICSNVINKLSKENVRVPEDIRLASFYNSTLLENNQPPITSLQFDVAELGMTSCSILLAQIDGMTVPEKTLLDYEVVMKESTKV